MKSNFIKRLSLYSDSNQLISETNELLLIYLIFNV